MADNVAITAGSGTSIATDDVGGAHYQRFKLDVGADGASSPAVGSVPTSHIQSTAVTATWTSATADETTLDLTVTGYASALAIITMDGAGASAGVITFEGVVTGSTPFAIREAPGSAAVAAGFSAAGEYPLSPGLATTPQVIAFNVAGLNTLRLRLSTPITGSLSVAIRLVASSATVTDTMLFGLNANTYPVAVAVDPGGNLQVVGNLLNGASVGGYRPVYVAGTDGSALRAIKTDADGNPQVDVLTLPALAAGTANIGDVDVLTLPSDPLGTNADSIGAIGGAGSISAKLRRATQGLEDLKSLIVLAAGTNAIGKLAANSGVDIGDVDVTSLPALPAGTNNIGDVDVLTIAAGTNTIGDVGIKPRTSGGLTTFHLVSAASTNATSVKASAGQLFGWYIYNSNAAARKVAFHNTAGTPTAGTSVAFSIVIPATSAANVFSDIGIPFATGIGITTVTGLADNDSAAVAANDLIINLWYA